MTTMWLRMAGLTAAILAVSILLAAVIVFAGVVGFMALQNTTSAILSASVISFAGITVAIKVGPQERCHDFLR